MGMAVLAVREQIDNLKEAVAAAEHVEKKMVKKQIKGIDTEQLERDKETRGKAVGWQGALPQCYLVIHADGNLLGRVTVELFADKLPKTAMNFCDLCSGSKGFHPLTRKQLSYKGSAIHRVVNGSFVQAITGRDSCGFNDWLHVTRRHCML